MKHRKMTRIILFLVVMTLIANVIPQASAAVNTLPRNLVVIEDEAFRYDESLFSLEIPDRVQRIGSLAFADSSLWRITIPDSVSEIADDAFLNDDQLTIRSTEEAYAHEYAIAHGIKWKDVDGSFDPEDIWDIIEREEPLFEEIDLDSLMFPRIEDLDTDDPEVLELVAEFNRYQSELEDNVSSIKSCFSQLKDCLEELDALNSGILQGINENGFSYGDFSYSYNLSDLRRFSNRAELISAYPDAANNSLIVEARMDNQTVYLEMGETGMAATSASRARQARSRAADPDASSAMTPSDKVANLMAAFNSFLTKYSSLVNTISSITNMLNEIVKVGNDNTVSLDGVLNSLRALGSAFPGLKKAVDGIIGYVNQNRNVFNKLWKVCSGVTVLINIADIIETLNSLFNDLVYLNGIKDVKSHGHPTVAEMMDEKLLLLAQRLDRDISAAQIALAADFVWNLTALGIKVYALLESFSLVAGPIGLGFLTMNIITKSVLERIAVSITRMVMAELCSATVRRTHSNMLSSDYELHNYSQPEQPDDPLAPDRPDPAELPSPVIHPVSQYTGDIPITETYFPDPAFREYVATYFDKDEWVWKDGSNQSFKDGVLTLEERDEAVGIFITAYYNVTDLTGIKFFRNMKDIIIRDSNITALDLSGFPELEKVDIEDVPLTTLNLCGCGMLKEISLYNTNITALDLRNLSSLQKVKVDWNEQLAALSVKESKNLTELSCRYCNISFFELPGEEESVLEQLLCRRNPISAMDVRGYDHLKVVDLGECSVEEFYASGNLSLESVDLYYNPLRAFDITGCTSLVSLDTSYLAYGDITYLKASGCTKLQYFSSEYARIENADFSGCTALESVYMRDQQVKNINLSGCSALERLDCSGNLLESLDLSDCGNLVYLSCDYNQLTDLIMPNCSALQVLECYGNKLESLDLINKAELVELDCHSNYLDSLVLTGCPKLKILNCNNNRLTILNLKYCPLLEDENLTLGYVEIVLR